MHSGSVVSRFWSKVLILDPESCWEWQAGLLGKYGGFWINGANRLAHRVCWEIHFGKIPVNLWVLHKCDNPICVNPYHLFLGTPKQNSQDRDRKGRAAINVRAMKGESNGMAKITLIEVEEIKRLSSIGVSNRKISSMFPISDVMVGNIVRGKSWK